MKQGHAVHKNSHLLLMFGILSVAIIGLVIGLLAVAMNKNTLKKNSTETSDKTTETVEEEKPVSELLIENETKIKEATSNEEKAFLHGLRASLLFDSMEAGDGTTIEQVLAEARKAEELAPDVNTAYSLYYYLDKSGDSEAANVYLRLATERGYDVNVGGRG